MKWISVKDRLPKLRQDVLTVDMNSGIKDWYQPYVMCFYNSDTQPKFTHWMPLPEPPENNK